MRFTAPILLTTAVLIVAGAASAESASAAPRFEPQAPPTNVSATGDVSSVTLSWAAPTTTGKEAPLEYTTRLTPDAGQPLFGLKFVRPTVHSVTYDHLTAGRTYTLSVSDAGRHGVSKPVSVTYTPQSTETLFAVDGTGTLVKTPVAGGATTSVAAGTISYAVDAAGDAFVLTSTTVEEITAAGVTTTLLTGTNGATALQLDSKNDVFLQEGATIVELPVGGTTTTTVLSSPARIQGWNVNPAGTVSALEANPGGSTLSIVSIPAGGPTTTRTVAAVNNANAFNGQFDSKGNLYFTAGYNGASGAQTAEYVPAGTTTVRSLGGGNFVQGVGLSDANYLLQSATWCNVPALNAGDCVPDLTVANISVTTNAGVTSTIPVTGLTVGRAKFTSGLATAVTSDTAGRIFVTETTGVVSYPSTGGAPTTVLSGIFSDVKLTS